MISGHDALAGELDRTSPARSAPSARSLLITVLGTFVLPEGRAAWTASLMAALGLVGVEDRTARQAIGRAGRAGWITGHKRGRRVRWQLTERAESLLSAGSERIYSFGRAPIEWDQRWLLLFASVPETQRELRYRLRVELNWAGFGSLGPGVWLSPWTEREDAARDALASLDQQIRARSFVAEHGHIGDPDSIVGEAWDLDSLADDYHRFIETFEACSPTNPTETGRALVALTHEWRRFPSVDPALPAALLPRHWPGHAAAELFAVRREAWGDGARRWWNSIEIDAERTA